MKFLLALFSCVAMADQMMPSPIGPDISWYDSRTMPGESYLLLDNCFVPIKSKKITDLCYIQKLIEKECGVKYELEAHCAKN